MLPDLDPKLTTELKGVLPFQTSSHDPELRNRLAWWVSLLDLYGVDHVSFIRCLSACARLALPLVDRREHRPREAIDIVDAWVNSASPPQDGRRKRAAENRLHVAVRELRRSVDLPGSTRWPKTPRGAPAEQAVLCTALACEEPSQGVPVLPLVYEALSRSHYSSSAAWKRAIAPLPRLLLDQRWPVSTMLPRGRCTPVLLVAWDWVCEQAEEPIQLSTAEIFEALCCCHRLAFWVPWLAGATGCEREVLKGIAQRVAISPDAERLIDGVLSFLRAR